MKPTTAKTPDDAIVQIIDEADALRYERALLQVQNLGLQVQLIQVQTERAQAQLQDLEAAMRKRYQLGDADRIDLAQRTIQRAPKAEG